jgi:hypothetical protein
VSALRFFGIVPLHSTYMLLGLVALGVSGVAQLVIDPGRGTDAAVPVCLLQMFAVSSGFSVPARRGHFDAVLTGGSSRLGVALTHWLVSVAPGVAVWLTLGVCEQALAPPGRGAVFSNGTIVAMVLISTLGWALSVPLPRLSGGVIWLVVLFVALTASGDWRAALPAVAGHGASAWSLVGMSLVCPLLLVGTVLEPRELLTLLPVLGAALLIAAAAVVWIGRANICLEASQ